MVRKVQISDKTEAPRRIRISIEYASREYPPVSDLGYASSTRPKNGINTAPPKKGKRFTKPVEVPAISVGKSSLIMVNPRITTADEHTEKTKNRIYRAMHGRPAG